MPQKYKIFDLQVDEKSSAESRKMSEALGVDHAIAQKLEARIKLFNEEFEREAKQLLKDAEIEEDEDRAREFLESKNISYTKLGELEAFTKSVLFESIGWKPKTPNDYFLLGMIFDRTINDSKTSVMNGLEKMLVKMLTD